MKNFKYVLALCLLPVLQGQAMAQELCQKSTDFFKEVKDHNLKLLMSGVDTNGFNTEVWIDEQQNQFYLTLQVTDGAGVKYHCLINKGEMKGEQA